MLDAKTIFQYQTIQKIPRYLHKSKHFNNDITKVRDGRNNDEKKFKDMRHLLQDTKAIFMYIFSTQEHIDPTWNGLHIALGIANREKDEQEYEKATVSNQTS